MARAASARVLAALVSPVEAPGVVLKILKELPVNPLNMRSSGALNVGSHNRVHGESPS